MLGNEIEMVPLDPVSLVSEEDTRMARIFEEIYTAARITNNFNIILMLDAMADSRASNKEAMEELEKIVSLISESN